jgi:DNA mismatch repair protein MutL
MPYSEFSQMLADGAPSETAPEPEGAFAPPGLTDGEDAALPVFTLRPEPGPAPRLDFGGSSIALNEPPVHSPPGPRLPVPETHGAFPEDAVATAPASLAELSDLRPLGQIHDSFIIAAGRTGLWIIDQHVAHERILFEKVLKQRAAGSIEVQHLLMPMVLTLTPQQQIEYARIAGELQASGFDTEPFGNRTIAVKSAPAALAASDLEKVLFEILEITEGELRGVSVDDLRRAIAASIACRAAIKINTPLDQSKMDWLLRALADTEFPMSCPHGRPIALQYSTREILKAFHRI